MMIRPELAIIGKVVNQFLKELTSDDEREQVLVLITTNICIHCGRVVARECYCMKDE